jgi:hypothetical protein
MSWAASRTCRGRRPCRDPLDPYTRYLVARADDRDTGIIELLSEGEPIGERVHVRPFRDGNLVRS